ncbi:MAG: GNAT family N-acetyltransferase [Nonlabens sp.]|uniref:GNAT family N-acetyltransferase n=1 Tax=Nonlabens sp. TaxID=1888209 RepID=UPI003EF6AD9F
MKYLLPNLETERLTFRLLEESDFEEWLPLFARPEVGTYLSMDKNFNQQQRCEKWFDKAMTRYKEQTGGMNVLIHKKTGKMIGQAGLLVQDVDDTKQLEVGYSILPEYWQQGYASEAAQFIKKIGFERAYDKDFGNALISVIHKENIGSQKVALNNGMTVYGPYPAEKDFVIYKQTREEWEVPLKNN